MLCKNCSRFRVFDPASTLYCFLFQVLNQESCKATLINFNLQRIQLGLKTVSLNTAGYVKSKKRLVEDVLKNIACDTGSLMDKSNPWRFKGRDVFLGDGTTFCLQDTKKIKKDYPLTYRLGKAQGLPKLRLFGIFSASTGAFLDGEIGAYCGKGKGEPTLLRKMLSRVKPRSILVLDRFFTNYCLQYFLRKLGHDYVIRARDKSAKKALGKKGDRVVNVSYDGRKKNAFYEPGIPRNMMVRYVKSSIKRPGFRVAHIYIITNLFDEDGYSKKDIEEIYLQRWGVELDIRNIKITLDGKVLRCKTPSEARKELWVHIIGYNLVRSIHQSCSAINNEAPRKQSFKCALVVFNLSRRFKVRDEQCYELLRTEILNSKYRREARAIKRRTESYPLLTVSRSEAKKQSWGYSRRRSKPLVEALGNREVA